MELEVVLQLTLCQWIQPTRVMTIEMELVSLSSSLFKMQTCYLHGGDNLTLSFLPGDHVLTEQ